MILHNGVLTQSVSVLDRSFQYGDGCFTTMYTENGCVQFWERHVKRMHDGLERLKIAQPDWQQVEHWVDQCTLQQGRGGVKLHITRGEGGRGYSSQGFSSPNVTVSQFVYPSAYDALLEHGMELTVCETQLGWSPLLAGLKHNNRLEQVLIKSEIEDKGHLDGIVCDLAGNVIETSFANLFWRKGNAWFTPDLSRCGVAGVIRQLVIENLNFNQFSLTIADFQLDHLLSADEIFITNAILGIAPITKINEHAYNVGEHTRKMQGTILSC